MEIAPYESDVENDSAAGLVARDRGPGIASDITWNGCFNCFSERSGVALTALEMS